MKTTVRRFTSAVQNGNLGWEAQVAKNVQRLRNHRSLALWCGGNEANPYAPGNTASMGISERVVALFDGTRPMRRTDPDGGSVHVYPDCDPTWYGKECELVPFMSETGMHNIPEAQSMSEVVDVQEFAEPLANMFSPEFAHDYPQFCLRFGEFNASRVPQMLSRASQIDNMRAPSLEALAQASQIGTSEFCQIVSEQMQALAPSVSGLIPWGYKRPWPVVAIMLVDGFGQPTAPYYFLKRTYENTHVALILDELVWAPGERIALHARLFNIAPMRAATITVEAFNTRFQSLWKRTRPAAARVDLGTFQIPANLRDNFFFLVADLRAPSGRLLSRATYWPRSLWRMEEATFRNKCRATPQPNITFDNGPWLKPPVAATKTTLALQLVSAKSTDNERARVVVRLTNTGPLPPFPVHIDIAGAKRSFYAQDNFFWLAPREQREVAIEILWRETPSKKGVSLAASAWNATVVHTTRGPASGVPF